jgi:hypothetical protein
MDRPTGRTVCFSILRPGRQCNCDVRSDYIGGGGPLWQPLCYAQIGGLAVATFITLLLVPVLYSIAVLDLKVVKWNER